MEKVWFTILICMAMSTLFADQNLLAPNLSLIAQEFNFSAQERDEKLGGEIALGFFLVGGIVSIFVGYLADTKNRCHLFSAIIILGELSCILTFFSTTYSQLLFSRILTGISIGGASPIVFSILGDLYAGESRVFISACYGMSVSIGAASGQILAGYMGTRYGWRSPFIIVALPAIILAVLILIFAKEPKRGEKDSSDTSLTSIDTSNSTISGLKRSLSSLDIKEITIQTNENLNKIQVLLRCRTIVLVYLQGIPGCIPWSIISVFLCDYLANDLNYSIQQSTLFMTLIGFGGFLGQLFGGWFGQYIYNHHRKFIGPFMGTAVMLSLIPLQLIINSDHFDENAMKSISLQLSVTFVTLGFLAAITGPNVRSVLQNVSPPESRGTAFALFTLSDDIGRGGGPAVIAFLVKALGGRRSAFSLASCSWLVCGCLLSCLYFTFTSDEAMLRDRVTRKGTAAPGGVLA